MKLRERDASWLKMAGGRDDQAGRERAASRALGRCNVLLASTASCRLLAENISDHEGAEIRAARRAIDRLDRASWTDPSSRTETADWA